MDVVSQFLQKEDKDLVLRAHQFLEDSYEFCANRQLVIIFPAPNSCGEIDNTAATRTIDEPRVLLHGAEATVLALTWMLLTTLVTFSPTRLTCSVLMMILWQRFW